MNPSHYYEYKEHQHAKATNWKSRVPSEETLVDIVSKKTMEFGISTAELYSG
jgi:hypothetical protein